MKDEVIFVMLATLLLGIGAGFGFLAGRNRPRIVVETQVDTLVRVDTIRVPQPVSVTTVVKDSIYVPVILPYYHTDTLWKALPREEKTYKDSTYKAVVSGFQPSLDYLELYPRYTTIVTSEVVTRKVPEKWSVGVQAGYGVGPNGLQPYVGIGLQYRLFGFGVKTDR